MKKLKIVIMNDFVPIPSASTINLLKHSLNFFNLEHDVEILTVEYFKQTKWKLKIKNVHDFFDLNARINIKYYRSNLIFYFQKYKLSWPFIKFLKMFPILLDFFDPQIKMSKYVIKNKIDLVYCRHVYRAAHYAILHGVPTIIESHNYSNPPDLRKLLKWSADKYFKGIVTISEELKKRFLKKGVSQEKILVLEDAAEIEKFDKITEDKQSLRVKLNLPVDKKIILYAGNLSEDRGIDVILKAAHLLDDNSFAFYFIGGNRNNMKQWKRYIIKNKIQANLIFLGFKPNKMIPSYLKAADILLATYSSNCLTLLWMSPIKVFEYMASKTPFIATRIGRMAEICDNDECLFTEPENPEDLCEKIKVLIENKNFGNELAKNAYNKAFKHTYFNRCKRILDFVN